MAVRNRPPRCPRCALRVSLCACAHIPQIDLLQTEVLVIMHATMRKASSNTARLASLAIRPCTVLIHGEQTRPLLAADLQPRNIERRRRLFLYPSIGAPRLDDEFVARNPGPYQLLLPDGAWGQTRKFLRRLPGLSGVQTVQLPPGPGQRFALRRQHLAAGISSGEAIARALGVLENKIVQQQLEEYLYRSMEQMMIRRGKAGSRAAALRGA